jgi:CspA family cold shock protein
VTINKINNNKKNKKMKNGVVKFYNEAKGFGFIKEENGPEIFVHATGLQEEIRENDNVVFDVQEGKKGLNAVNVKLA